MSTTKGNLKEYKKDKENMIKNFSSSSFKEVDSDKLQHITGGWAQYLIPVIVSGINHSDQIIKGWKKGFHRNH